jgi:hypothetical protein
MGSERRHDERVEKIGKKSVEFREKDMIRSTAIRGIEQDTTIGLPFSLGVGGGSGED